MSDIDTIVNVTIAVASSAPTRASFGTQLIAAYHNHWSQWVREYSDPSEMLDDGFSLDSAAYLKAASIWGQQPHPATFKIGRLSNAWTYTYRLGPQNITQGFKYEFTIKTTDIEYTVPAAATKAIVAGGLQALINAITGVTAAVVATEFVEVEDDIEGRTHAVDLKDLDLLDDLTYENVTPDPGIVADLTQIRKVDDDWYGLLLDMSSKTIDLLVAGWIEGLKKIYITQTSDSAAIDPGVSSDILSSLKSAAYKGTATMFRRHPPYQLPYASVDAAWLGLMLTFDPGTATWALKELSGVPTDNLQTGWKSTIEAKNGNMYVEVAGLGSTWEGKTAQGEWIDVTRFIDFLHNRIQTAVYAVKRNAPGKVPFDDIGIASLRIAVESVLKGNVSKPGAPLGLAADPPFTVTVPRAIDTDPLDRAERKLKTIDFTARLSGAIHRTTIKGKVSV